MKQDRIVILDLGSTENTTIARAVRALGVYSEIYPHDISAAELTALPGVKGVCLRPAGAGGGSPRGENGAPAGGLAGGGQAV